MRTFLRTFSAAALLAALAVPAYPAAVINIINMDGPGEGFNDATPALPVGGNTGTTIGQQRLNCFTQAANIWGSLLTSAVPIDIQAAFNPLTCTATSAVLGSAGPRFVEINDPAFEFQGFWYHEALANKQAGIDLVPPFGTDNGSEINAQFNSNLGNVGCLTGSGWYYGFDHNEGANIDLLAVLLHEFGHGLGFSTTTSGSTGAYLNGPPSAPAVWDRFLLDETSLLHWNQNTAPQRVASAINTNNLVWDGAEVTAAAAGFLAAAPELVVPYGSGSVAVNTAAFGPALTLGGTTGQAIVVVDPTAPINDGCETPFTNAGALAGKVAVIDRGLCGFTVKVKNAQNAGAIACILVNNVAGTIAPGGSDPTITIPSVAITQADGVTLKNAIAAGTVNVTMRLSPTQRAGMQPSGRVRMYAPNPFQGGSSVSHYDISTTPNLLMEPAINPDLTSSVDLTEALFRDIGWLPHLLGVPGSGPATRIALASNPNPARGNTRVHFELAADERVELTLYDLSGRRVRSLAKGTLVAGPHDVTWDGLDQTGRPAAPGVYLARLKGSRTHATHHIVLVN
ncbi:MAG: PA domain-containing protein [Candidatus Eisenbacteria bacterium]